MNLGGLDVHIACRSDELHGSLRIPCLRATEMLPIIRLKREESRAPCVLAVPSVASFYQKVQGEVVAGVLSLC